MLLKSRTATVSIARKPADVARFIAAPENLAQWLTFVTGVRKSGDDWILETEDGPLGIRFIPANDLGVVDHHVRLPDGTELMNPMRVVANGEGCEVLFTLFQLPGWSEEQFAQDARTVEEDLQKLKDVLEGAG